MLITDCNMVTHKETIDYIGHNNTGIKEWAGKIVTKLGIFEFKIVKQWSESNGSTNTEITSIRPKRISVKEWDILHDEMIEFIDEQEE